MLTGIGAIGAAGVSIHFLRKQIAGTDKLEARRRSRRLASARARLPLSLSETNNYTSDALSLLKHCLDAVTAGHGFPQNLAELPNPILPEQAILSFAEFIEATDDDRFAGVIASMISEMQVLNSRIQGLRADGAGLGALGLQSYIFNAAKVSGYASSMYEYARRESDEPPHRLDWNAVTSSLRLAGFYQDDYPDLHAFVARARGRAEEAEPAG
jgi:hypothetical protein